MIDTKRNIRIGIEREVLLKMVTEIKLEIVINIKMINQKILRLLTCLKLY